MEEEQEVLQNDLEREQTRTLTIKKELAGDQEEETKGNPEDEETKEHQEGTRNEGQMR